MSETITFETLSHDELESIAEGCCDGCKMAFWWSDCYATCDGFREAAQEYIEEIENGNT